MRKVHVVLAGFLFILGLASCSGKGSEKSPTVGAGESPVGKNVAEIGSSVPTPGITIHFSEKPSAKTETPEPMGETDEFLLMFKEDVLKGRVDQIVREFPGTLVKKHTFYLAMGEHYIFHLRVPKGSTVDQWVKHYQDLPETKYAQPYYPGQEIKPPPD